MTFEIPPSEKDKPENRFPFTLNGQTYSVPLLRFAPVEASLLFEVGRNVEGLLLCAGDEAADELRKLDRAQLSEFETAWVAASRVSPGESGGSADS